MILEKAYVKLFNRIQALDRTLQESSKEFAGWRRETTAEIFEWQTQTQYSQDLIERDISRLNAAFAELYGDQIPPTKIVNLNREEN